MNNPTIVSAALSDKELQDSINKMVANFDKGLQDMLDHSNEYVGKIQESLQKIGNTNFGAKGSNDGGVVKRTKAQNADTEAVEKNIAARDKQIKKNQEVSMSFDQMAAATQKATSGSKMSVIETYDMQIEMFKNRLREVRQDIDIFNAAIGSGKKTQIEWGQQGLKQANAEAEKLMRIITTLENQRGNLANVIAPQGHTIQNYVNSLQRANPELAQLNDSFKRGQSLMQNGITTTQQLANAQGELSTKTNQQKQSLDEQNDYIRQNVQREQERRDAIRQTGLAARETADQLIRSAHEQASAQGNSPITGIKELTVAVEKMRSAYFDMSASEKASPIGLALEADIKRANDAISVIRKYNQSLLGSQQNDANKITNASTLNSLRESLKNLTEQYSKLTVAELNAGKGDALIQHFQDTTRAAQILQRTLNRPVNLKAALSGDERTLDDIAYKMQRLRSYRQGIDLTKPNAANEIKQVDEALARLQKDADKWMSKSQDLIKNNTTLGRSWNYMKNRLAFYFTVGAGTQFIKNLIEVRSQYEMNERALGILINSAERGTQIFNELSQMALVSPYTLIELSSAAKQLTAYDVAAKDVVDTTRRLADMAAAVGIPIERLTYALGQIKAYGYLNSRDARMFANAGIPLVKQLSDYYTELEGRLVSTADVYDRIKKKAIDYNEVMEVINKMTDQGGKFFDFQAKMADTLKVRLANLTLAWNNMLNDMGKESQGVLTWGIGALRDLFLQWKQLHNLIENAALAVGIRTLLVALRAATIGLGSFGKAMTWNAILGKKLGGVVVGLAKSFGTLFSSRLTWFALLAIAAVEATQAIFGVNEAQKALNESIRNGAKDNYDNISKFLEQYKEVRESLYSTQAEQQVGQDIDKNEAKKAWEAVREQIELTVASSDKYIGNLLSVSNMSERVRQGFNLLDDVQIVNAALKELDDDTIKVSKDLSAWWNAWQAPDGLIGNLKDYQETLNDIIAKYGTLESFRENTFLGGKGSDDLNDYETALERFRDDLQKTTDSVLNFIELKGWSGDEGKINQVFEQITQKLVLDNQLDPQKAFTLQTEVEEARSKAAKQALLQRINDERAALKISHDNNVREALAADIERYKNWDETNGRSKVEWERFTKWLKEQHISETTAMFRNMDAEDIKSLNFQEGKHAEWVTRMVTQYAKEHKMSYDEAFKYLRSWVRSANQWSIFIPLTISTENKKSVYDQLGEYDKAIDEADAQIERLTKRIGELNAKKQKSKEETQELANAEQELADAQKAKADAEAKGGHGKKEKKDERAANKAAKQAESELQKALKDELSTIDKVRSIYKDLTKDGMSHANAVERATRGWDETVNAINKVLQKNGLQKLDLSKFAGIENPRELVNMLQSQLNTLLKRGASTSEIRVLQTKIQTVSVEADKYDLTMITKGLNNELGKLKDEYELAVELDADPELGGIFADMFDLNVDQLPHSINEYAERVTTELNKALKKRGDNIQLPTIYLTKDDIDAFREMSDDKKLNTKSFEDIQKAYQDFVSLRKKAATDVAKIASEYIREYGDLSAQIQQIEIEKNDALMKLNEIYNTDALRQTRRYLDAKFAIEDGAKRKQAKATFDALKKEADYERFFTAIDTLTKKDALSIKNKIKKGIIDAFKNGGLTISQFRKEIKALEEQFDKLSQPTSNWISYLNGGFDKLIQRAKETGQEIETIGEKISATGKVDEEDKNYLQSLGNIFSNGKGGNTDFSSLMSQFGKDMKGLGSNISKAGQGMQGASSNFASTVSIIDMIIKNIHQTVQSINSVIQELDSVRNEENKISNAYWEGFSKSDSYASSGWENLKSGNISGAIADTANSIISIFNTFENAKTDRINSEIKESEREVKRLENSYKILEFAADKAYGTAIAGANQATKANKELQLAELKRQLALEQSRDSKNKDEDKIIEIRGQIIDLEHEIKDFTKNAVNDLLGISSHGDFFESMISEMIDAFKNGEDAMKVFEEKWSDMIDNMIMKTIVSQVLSQWVKTLEHGANEILEKYTKESSKKMSDLASHITNLRTMDAGDVARWIYENDKENFDKILESLGERNDVEQFFSRDMWFDQAWDSGLANKIKEAYFAMLNSNMSGLQSELDKASLDATGELIDYYGEAGKEFKENYLGQILDKIQENWNFGQDSEKQLSNLQQGIQGITEDTAGALEAITNSISQQSYLQSDLLTQIRDAVVSMDMDVSLGVMSQILLQLQNSYQTQQAIQQILEGVLVPSGRAFAVELLS